MFARIQMESRFMVTGRSLLPKRNASDMRQNASKPVGVPFPNANTISSTTEPLYVKGQDARLHERRSPVTDNHERRSPVIDNQDAFDKNLFLLLPKDLQEEIKNRVDIQPQFAFEFDVRPETIYFLLFLSGLLMRPYFSNKTKTTFDIVSPNHKDVGFLGCVESVTKNNYYFGYDAWYRKWGHGIQWAGEVNGEVKAKGMVTFHTETYVNYTRSLVYKIQTSFPIYDFIDVVLHYANNKFQFAFFDFKKFYISTQTYETALEATIQQVEFIRTMDAFSSHIQNNMFEIKNKANLPGLILPSTISNAFSDVRHDYQYSSYFFSFGIDSHDSLALNANIFGFMPKWQNQDDRPIFLIRNNEKGMFARYTEKVTNERSYWVKDLLHGGYGAS